MKFNTFFAVLIVIMAFNISYSNGWQAAKQVEANAVTEWLDNNICCNSGSLIGNGDGNAGANLGGGGGNQGGGGGGQPGGSIDVPGSGFNATVSNNSQGGSFVSTVSVGGSTYQIYNLTDNTGATVQARPEYVAVLISGGGNGGGGGQPTCSAALPNLMVEDIYLVQTNAANGTNIDELNLGIDIEYTPYALVRNISCLGTDAAVRGGTAIATDLAGVANKGSFPVRLSIDFNLPQNGNSSYDTYDQTNFVGPLGGGQSMVVAFKPIRFTANARHMLRVEADPLANEGALRTCAGGNGCVRESAQADNIRIETMRTTPPSVTLGTVLYANPPTTLTGRRQDVWWIFDGIDSRVDRDLKTDPVFGATALSNSGRPRSNIANAVGIRFQLNKVNPANCTVNARNGMYLGTPREGEVNSMFGSGGQAITHFGGIDIPGVGVINSSYRFNSLTPSWPNLPARNDNGTSWLYADYMLNDWRMPFATFGRGITNFLKPQMNLYVNLGYERATSTGIWYPVVAEGNYHQFNARCTARDGSVVSDSVVVKRGNSTTPVTVQPSLPDVTVNASTTLTRLPFTIRNNSDRPVSGLSYVLRIGGVVVNQVTNSSTTVAIGGTLSANPLISWRSPNASTTVPTELCVTHPGMATTTPVCDRGLVRVVTNQLSCNSFTIDSNNLPIGATTTVRWSTRNAQFVVFQELTTGDSLILPPNGSRPVSIPFSTNFELIAYRGAEQARCNQLSVVVAVANQPDLEVTNFTASPCTNVVATTCPSTSWSARVQNIGLATRVATTYVLEQLYRPTGTTVWPTSWQNIGTGPISILGIAQVQNLTGTRANLAPGDYRWRVVVNPAPPAFAEASRLNNVSGEYAFTIREPNRPQCNDRGIDNDNDGVSDRNDRGCYTDPFTGIYDPTDDTESQTLTPATITVTADTLVRYDSSTTIRYSIQSDYPQSCTIIGPGMPTTPIRYTPRTILQGTAISSKLQSAQNFTFSCDVNPLPAGVTSGAATETIKVEVVPKLQEV